MPLFNNLGIITGSIYLYKDGESLTSSSRLVISPDFSNIGKYDFSYETTGSTPIKLLTLSSSGNDPRVGIGNESPQTTLDIKDVSDTAVGAEILVRSSRTTKGGDVGDAAGKILFVIDSGSYIDVKTSGSVATITTEVTAINDKMAGGDLIFKVSDKGLSDPSPFEIMRLSRDTSDIINDQVIISGYVTASGNITSNNIVKGNILTSTTSATIGTFVYADNIRIGTNTAPTSKGLYVSGNITSSNDLSIRGFSSVSSSLASTARFPYTGSALITGSLTVTGSVNSNGGFTGSLLGTSSYAVTASHALNGGVTSIIAGSGISVNQSTGAVTITNTGGSGGSTFPYTGSAIISGSLTVTGSTAITGGFDALGTKGSRIQLGTYNVGYDIIGFDTFFITGAGLIISGNMPDQNHHNLLKIGNVEMVDINTAVTTNEFLIHNVNTLRITSGADGGNITTGNQLLKIGGGEFYVYRAGGADSAGIIQSAGSETKITDTFVTLYGTSGSYFYIPNTNEITTLNGTDYLMGFVANPSPPGLSYKIKADKFIWAAGSNQIISGGLTVTGSLRASSMTSSLLGTASYAITASYALSSAGGGGGVTINNNTDNYIITATGTANTLNGEANLQFSGSTLVNRGRSNFASSGTGVANTTHYFKQTTGDTYAGFLIADADGEDLVKVEGTLANSDAKITIGDVGNAYNSTNIIVDDPNNKIELTGKVYPNSLAVKATTLSTVGSFDIGSRIADDWSTTGPTLTAGRIVYLSGSLQWAQAQANTTGSSYGMLGVVTSAESQREVLIEGTIQISGSALSSGIAGQPVYLSPSTAGQVTLTAPTTTGQIVRVLGFVTKANSNIMYFRPDNNWIVI
jgi:hypothetical protein